MKRTSIIAALAIIAFSATQVLAYQFDNYEIDKELMKDINTSIQDMVNTQYQEQQVKDENDPYKVYLHAYLDLIFLMDDTSLWTKRKKTVRKEIFTVINNLSNAILNLPEYNQENYYSIAEHVLSIDQNLSHNPFVYFGRAVTLQELFDYAIKNKSIVYDENTPVVKILAIQKKLNDEENENNSEMNNQKTSVGKLHNFWKGISEWLQTSEGKSVLEGFQSEAAAGK